ncbi:MAG TPA: hypothetical protein DHW49_02245 [Anaerolineae bacterium]|nr:hypothetical protein [Anaerolineae bacterium]
MAFTSYDFLLFFFIIFIIYWLIRERHWQNLILLVASYYFYGYIQAWYAIMLGLSTSIDYFLARAIVFYPNRKKIFILISLFMNLGVLAFFKYYNFFISDVIAFLNTFNIHTGTLLISIALPAGLSFFTLKKLGYMIDVSRGTLQPTNNFINFALYVSFFPQLIAGPIERPQKLIPQIESQRQWKAEFFYQAWPLLVMGFFKKIVIADSVQVIVNRIFGFDEPSILLLLIGGLGYTLQILADFSAYTDISRGIAYLIGFETSENFNKPYLSLTPTDFWNRWHITLSTWLRDYIFFPIRRTLLQYKLHESLTLALPPIVTMFISGIWHGANLNFVIWGLYYGILIAIYQLIGIRGDWKTNTKIKTLFAWFVMFCFIVFGWIIFRSPSINWLINIFSVSPLIPNSNELIFALISINIVVVYTIPLVVKQMMHKSITPSWLYAIYYAVATLLIIIFTNSSNSDFIYFQF